VLLLKLWSLMLRMQMRDGDRCLIPACRQVPASNISVWLLQMIFLLPVCLSLYDFENCESF